MASIRIVTVRAPGLIPSLVREVAQAKRPVVLIPESFTLACETAIVKASQSQGFFDMKVFSPSSLVREIREMTGLGSKKPVSADGQNMVISRVLHQRQNALSYYRDSVAQPTLAKKVAEQMNAFARARLSPAFLRTFQPASRRTQAKLQDMALLWEGYQEALGEQYEDAVGQWMTAVQKIGQSGIVRDAQLLIYGFDYITHDILHLVENALQGEGAASEVVLGLICDAIGPDRDIFKAANDSVLALTDTLRHHRIAPFTLQADPFLPAMDAGIAYVEKTIYAHGPFAEEKIYTRGRNASAVTVIRDDPGKVSREALQALAAVPVPDMSHVAMYYAKNSYLECQHACQTLIAWHREGIAWEDMAIAVCEQEVLPSLLPLTLKACGIPFNAKQDQPILMSDYAQYLLSLLRILRLNFCLEDVLRLMKTGFTPLQAEEVMDMENFARKNGIHRSRWRSPFWIPEKGPEKEKREALECLRQKLIAPIEALEKQLSRKGCTGKHAASLLFQFITDQGIYERLLQREEALALQGDDLGIDRNRQVWTAVNELLDSVANFIGDEALPLRDLCTMLESSLAGRMIKSLPQLSRAVTVAPPQMFFSDGIRCVLVMGLQENELSSGSAILSERERLQLEAYIEAANREYYLNKSTANAFSEERSVSGPGVRPYSKIGQSLLDLAAREKQDVYQAVSLARERLAISCSGAKPSGAILIPSAAFRKLARLVNEVCPGNVTGGLMDADIHPFAPAFALETLAVKLRDAKGGPDALTGDGAEKQLWQGALAALYQSSVWKARTEGVLQGLHSTIQSPGIAPSQAQRLYLPHGMTISRIETFGSCPYRHLLQYGLDLFSAGAYVFQKNEQGTFNHDVLKQFLNEAMHHPDWPTLSEAEINRLLNRILRQRAKQWQGGILTADMAHRYQGAAIIHSVRTSVHSMMRAFSHQPHFLPFVTEIPFGKTDESSAFTMPPIQIETKDGNRVAFSGRIDRIDRLVLPDGKTYFMVVDNKLSTRDVKQNSIVAGLQLQLPLYILAAQNGLPRYTAAGGVYQPIRDVLVDGSSLQDIPSRIDKELQTSGMILDDSVIQEAMMPVRIAKKADTNDVVSVVSSDELQAVIQAAMEIVTDRVERISGGETAPLPLKDGQEPPCAYCEHADACRFDSTLPGCRIREVDHKHRMEL